MINLYLLYELHFKLVSAEEYVVGYLFEKNIDIYYIFKNFKFNLNELSLIFIILISFLYPLILILLQYDLSIERYKYYGYMV